MQPWVVGVSHETADVSLREAASLDAALIPSALAELAAAGAEEAVIVSTCNRTELYLVTGDGRDAREVAREFFSRRAKAGRETALLSALYAHEGEEAARHLFAVAAGLRSLVLGEDQILGQVKEAYRLAAASAPPVPSFPISFSGRSTWASESGRRRASAGGPSR